MYKPAIPNSRSEKLDLGSPSSHVILGNIIVTVLYYAVVISLHRAHYYYIGMYSDIHIYISLFNVRNWLRYQSCPHLLFSFFIITSYHVSFFFLYFNTANNNNPRRHKTKIIIILINKS